MSDTLAVIAGKLSAQAIRMMGLGLGSNLPGRVSLKIAPSVLSHLSSQARKGVVAVSGTNGKSTTSGLIASIFTAANQKIVHNRQGANLLTGIAATVVDASNWTGNLDADFCLFEIDEAALPVVAKEVKIGNVVVTNLFRDQLDRFGELDTTAKLITSGIAVNSSAAILNADDPNVAQMVPNVERLFYGIKNLASETCGESHGRELIGEANTSELSYCPACGNEYVYDLLVYGQLGHYRCSCGHKRPEPSVFAENVKVVATGSQFTLNYESQKIEIELNLPGTFNVYNALAAAALAFKLGLPADAIKKGLCTYSTLFGRSERVTLDGKQILIQLIKNPAGASQALQAAARDRQGKFLIALNDNYADGRDVSWIWDADFEQLSECAGPFVVSGTRCHDLAVRLKYAGVAAEKITVEPSLDRALDRAKEICGGEQMIWLLPTYTCLLELQRIFKARGTPLAGT